MRLGVHGHNEIRELNLRIGRIEFAAHLPQLRGRLLRDQAPNLYLCALELELSATDGLTHSYQCVLDLLNQLTQHPLDRIVAARCFGLRTLRIEHRGARLERETRGDIERALAQPLAQ